MTETPYRPVDRPRRETAEQLRARIPGWGTDLDPQDRPSFPQEVAFSPPGGEAPCPTAQPERWPRERSIEHPELPAVFGTSCPPRGVSGAIRKLAYARYSEARAAHWLLLLAADRVEILGEVPRSFVTRRPDNPISQTGVLSEVRRHGVSSRVGRDRVDVGHHLVDPVIVGLPWVLGARAAFVVVRRLRAARSPQR